MKRKPIIFILALLAISLLLAGCSNKSPKKTVDSFSLPVGFVPNVQFAPLYVALEKGFFTEENIELTLDHSMETDTVALVGAGQIPFGICSGEQVLLGRNQGLPLVYISGWYQKYPVGIVSLQDNGIKTMEDLRGKKVGTPVLSGASYIGLEALLQQAGMTDSDIRLETIGYAQVEMLVSKKVDSAVIYIANEPEQLKAEGYNVNVISVADSLSMVGNGLITNEKTISENPDLVQRMVRAFIKGIIWTKENPDAAYDICLKYVDNLKNAANQELQKEVLKQSIQLYETDKNLPIGFSDEESWLHMTEVMIKMGLLKPDFSVEPAFTNTFAEKSGEQ
ncbi:MAG: ABC transporter substrate-binding protein [Flexilinea sp.]